MNDTNIFNYVIPVFGIYRLYRDKYTENQIAEQMKIDVDEVRNILEKFKE